MIRPNWVADPETLWIRHVLALVVIVLLMVGSYLASTRAIEVAKSDTHVLNMSGRQGILSQRIAYFSTEFAEHPTLANRTALNRTIEEFEKNHRELVSRADLCNTMKSLYFEVGAPATLNTLSRQYTRMARQVMHGDADARGAALQHIRATGPDLLLQRLKHAAQGFEDLTNENQAVLNIISQYALIAAMAVLSLEAAIVFWPTARRVRNTLKDLETAREVARQSADEANRARERLWQAIDSLRDGLAIYDPDDRLVLANRAFREMHAPIAGHIRAGVSFEEILRAGLERDVWDIGQESPEAWIERQLVARAADGEFDTEVHFCDGRIMLRREKRTPAGEVVGLRIDVTNDRRKERELKLAKAELEKTVYTDYLTGLGNRSSCEKQLYNLTRKKRVGTKFAVIHLDLDRFKKINDTMGHAAGDQLLAEIGRRLRILMEDLEQSSAYRWGGDEFVVICDRSHSIDIEKVCQDITDLLAVPMTIEGLQIWPSASVGVARYPEDGQDTQSLFVFADLALYEAKERGRDNYHFFTRELKDRVDTSKTIESELRRAVAGHELQLYYQPQVNVADGTVTGVETLIRWQHPEKGLLSPAHFMEIAEQSNLAVPVGRIVIETAMGTARKWRDAGIAFGRIAINVSPKHLSQDRFYDEFLEALERHDLAPEFVTVEVVESILIDDTRNRYKEILGDLLEKGVCIELDDFGTGYASLSHLTSIPLTGVKIDKSFTEGILTDQRKLGVAKALINIGKLLNVRIVCEGVESREQVEALRNVGPISLQGYHLAKPMPLEEAETWLQDGSQYAVCGTVPAKTERTLLTSGAAS